MTLQLPAPVVRRLARSPLSLVVCQVRIEENLRLAEPRLALRLREGFSEAYPKITRLSGPRTQLIQQASGIQVEQLEVDRRRGHRLSSEANDWHITLEPDAFALETTGYTTWTEFLPRFQELVTFVSQELSQNWKRASGSDT